MDDETVEMVIIDGVRYRPEDVPDDKSEDTGTDAESAPKSTVQNKARRTKK